MKHLSQTNLSLTYSTLETPFNLHKLRRKKHTQCKLLQVFKLKSACRWTDSCT